MAEEVKCRARAGDIGPGLRRLERCGADAELRQLAQGCLKQEDNLPDAGAVVECLKQWRTAVQRRAEETRVQEARREEAEARVEAEKRRAEAERQKAEEERLRAEAEREKAEAESQRAEKETQRAEEQRRRTEAERRAKRRAQWLAAVVVFAAVAAVFVALWFHRLAGEREEARWTAVEEAAKLQLSISDNRLAKGLSSLETNNAEEAISWLAGALEQARQPKATLGVEDTAATDRPWLVGPSLLERHPEYVRLLRLRLSGLLNQMPRPVQVLFHDDPVTFAQYSPAPAGRWIVSAAGRKVLAWDPAAGTSRPPWEHPGQVQAVALHPSQPLVLTAAADETNGNSRVLLWEIGRDGPLWEEPVPGAAMPVLFDSTGRWIAASSLALVEGRVTSRLLAWDARTKKQVVGHPYPAPILAMSASPHESLMAVATGHDVWLWDLSASKTRFEKPFPHGGQVNVAEFDRRGKRLATATDDCQVRVWDVVTGRRLWSTQPLASPPTKLQFSANGEVLYVEGAEVFGFYDSATGGLVPSGNLHPAAFAEKQLLSADRRYALAIAGDRLLVNDLAGEVLASAFVVADGPIQEAFFLDSERVLTLDAFKQAAVWDLATGKRLSEREDVRLAAASRSGNRLALADSRGVVCLDRDGHKVPWKGLPREAVGAMALDTEGRRLAAAVGRTVWLCEIQGEPPPRKLDHEGEVVALEWSPSDDRLFSASEDLPRHRIVLRVWDPENGRIVCEESALSPVSERSFSAATGQWLVLKNSNEALLIDARTGEARISLPHWLVQRALFDPPGHRVLTSGMWGDVKLWDATSGEAAMELPPGQSRTTAVSVSPDGALLALAAEDRSLRVVDAATGLIVFKPRSPLDGAVRRIAWSPDGTRLLLVLGRNDELQREGFLRVWDIGASTSSDGDLIGMAEFLTGAVAGKECLRPGQPEDPRAEWEALRERGAAFLRCTEAQVAEFHAKQGREAEKIGDNEAALSHYETLLAMERFRDLRTLQADRGRMLYEIGRLAANDRGRDDEEAQKQFREAEQVFARVRKASPGNRRFAVLHALAVQVQGRFREAANIYPKEPPENWRGVDALYRGNAYAETALGDPVYWPRATADFEQAIAMNLPDYLTELECWRNWALALLIQDKKAEYHAVRNRLAARCGKPAPSIAAQVARIITLAPAEDRQMKAYLEQVGRSVPVGSPCEPAIDWRRGDLARAISTAESMCRTLPEAARRPPGSAFLAMIFHADRAADRAKTVHDQGHEWLQQARVARTPSGKFPLHSWADLVESQLLLAEAERELQKPVAPRAEKSGTRR